MGAAKDYFLNKKQVQAEYIESEPAPQQAPSLWNQLTAGDVQGILGRLSAEFTDHPNTIQDVPQDLSQYYDVAGAYDSDYENQGIEATPQSQGIQANAMRDINEWGGKVASDLGTVWNARDNAEFQQGLANVYNDIADPAMMAAVTPGLPPHLRAAAGIVAAPKFVGDVVGAYQDTRSGTATGEAMGPIDSALNVGKQFVIDPVTGLVSNVVNRPGEMAQEISEHPAELWRQVLMPAAIPMGIGEAGLRARNRRKAAVADAQKEIDEGNASYERWQEEQKVAAEEAARKAEADRAEAARIDAINARLEGLYGKLVEAEDYENTAPVERPAYQEEAPSLGSDFDSWFEGMSRQESGGDYSAVNDKTGASGRYQILPENWSNWAEEAGLEPWAERTPENQDIVARHKMQQYYDEYGPEGALAAWYAGPANGERWARGETTDVWGKPWDAPQETGPSIAEYVRSASAHAEDARGGGLEPLTEKYYNITDEVSDTALTDLTEQKLNYLARDYAERYGENLDLTSMKRSGDGSSWHDSGQAFDIANDRLAKDPEARAWLMEQAQRYGLYGLDEYTNPSAHATGGHLHFSDHGEPLRGGAGRRQPAAPAGRAGGDVSEAPAQSGEMTDIFGRDFSNESMGRMNDVATQLNQRIENLYAERDRLMQDSSVPEVQRYNQVQRLEQEIAQAEAFRSQMDEAMGGRIRGLGGGEYSAYGRHKGNGSDPYAAGIRRGAEADEAARVERERQEAMADEFAQRTRWNGEETSQYGGYENPGGYAGMGNVPGQYKAGERARVTAERNQAKADDMARRMAGDRGETSVYRGYEGTANNPYGQEVGRYKAGERARVTAERNQAKADEFAQRLAGDRGEASVYRGYENEGRDTYLDDVISRTKDKRTADIEGVRQYRDTLAQELRAQLDAEVERMEQNPGGQGTNNGYLFDDSGNIVSRYGESNNPQWYQDFYREYGRAPRKGEYERIAYDNLRKNQEFAEMDRNLRRADEYLKRFEENPMLDPDAMMEDVDNLISYDRSGKAGRRAQRRAEVEAMYDEAAEAEGMPRVQLSQKGSSAPPAGGGKGTTETIKNKDYFSRMRELFGTLRLGRTPRDANGFFDPRQNVARADEWGNYDTMWHEIGHRLDSQYDLSTLGKNHPGEMVGALQRKYGSNIPYKPSEYTSEGIAEFIKEYVQRPDTARQNFPGMTKDFERLLSRDKDLAGRIKEAQDMSRTHTEQPTGAKIAGGIVKDEPKTFKQKATDFLHDFMQNWVDDKQGIKRAEKEIEKIIGRKLSSEESAYIYSRIAKDRGVSAATQMLTGKDPQAVKDALNKLYGGCVKNAVTLPEVVKSLEDVAKDNKDWLEAEGLKDANEALSAYTVAQRFMEVYDLKYSNPLQALKDKLSQAEADLKKAEAAEAQAKAKLKGSTWNTGRAQAQRDYDAAHKAAVAARKAQRAAAHAVAKKEEMGYKMPLEYEEYQDFVDNAPEALKKAAQGVYDLNENVVDIMHHEGIISDEVHKYLKDNHKHYVSLARDFPDDANIGKESFAPSSSFVNVGTPLKKLSEEGSFKDVKDPMQQMAKNIFNAMSLVERNKVGRKLTDLSNLQGVGGIVEKVTGDASTKDSTFYVWKNGKKEVYATTPEIYNALKSFKPESIDGMMKYLGELPARWMRAGAVVYNPAFVAKNAFRDQFTAYLFSEYGYKPFWDMAKGIYHILKKDELYQEFKTSGTLMSTIVNAAKDYSGELLKDAQRTPKEKVFRRLNPLANLEALSNYAEMGTRMGLYAKARKSGASIIDATMEAREGTLDFGKAGIKGRAANRYMPFFNATIQDTALLFEKFKKNPARMAQRLAPMVLGSLALYAFIRSHDDLSKEYDELMPYERNMFWNVPVPKAVCETGWLRFPKPFGPGFLFGSLPERLADLAAGHDKSGKQMKEWATGYLGSLVPGAMPPLVQAGVEWGSGYSFFRERDIVPAREKEMKAPDQYGPDTSHFAKWAGEQTGLSPRKIDNLGQNLFAGAYGGVTSLHDAATGEGKKVNMPWETLKLDPWRSPQSTQDYYDRRKDVREAEKSRKERGREMSYEDKKDYARTTKVDQKLQKYNQKLRRAQEDHDDEEARRLKREIAEMLDRELDMFEKR